MQAKRFEVQVQQPPQGRAEGRWETLPKWFDTLVEAQSEAAHCIEDDRYAFGWTRNYRVVEAVAGAGGLVFRIPVEG